MFGTAAFGSVTFLSMLTSVYWYWVSPRRRRSTCLFTPALVLSYTVNNSKTRDDNQSDAQKREDVSDERNAPCEDDIRISARRSAGPRAGSRGYEARNSPQQGIANTSVGPIDSVYESAHVLSILVIQTCRGHSLRDRWVAKR